MAEAHILQALGLPEDATEKQIAAHLWSMAGFEGAPRDCSLWMRFIDALEPARCVHIGPNGPSGDRGYLANSVVERAIAGPGEPGENEWGTAAWDAELGVGWAEADEMLREFVCDEIAPRLNRAGLYYLL